MGAIAAIGVGLGQLVSGGIGLMGAGDQAKAQREQAQYQKTIAEGNAKVAGIQADDAILQGEKAARQVESTGSKVQGDQRAAFAAQGIEADSGTAADVQTDTQKFSALDALTVRNNAKKAAWGYRVQGAGYTAQGNLNYLAGINSSNNTLLTGGLNFFNSAAKAGYTGFSQFGGGGSSSSGGNDGPSGAAYRMQSPFA